MVLRFVLIVGILTSLHLSTAHAASSDWVFVWVSSGSGKYDVSQGKASVKMLNGKLTVEMVDGSGIHYNLSGDVVKNTVTAKFNVVGGDYFINSPFYGSYRIKRWSGFIDSKGRESLALTDGWNFIGISRELH
jgi:hypothetical protein